MMLSHDGAIVRQVFHWYIELTLTWTVGNSIAPLVFAPGFVPLGMLLALPATLLAAVIERPFYTRTGIGAHAIWYSMQANFVSLVAGIFLLPVTLATMPLGSVLAVAISVIIEWWYLAWQCPRRCTSWGWMIGANVISSIVLLVLPGISFTLADDRSPLILRPTGTPFDWPHWATGGVCLLAFIFSFLAPRILPTRQTP